MARHARTRVPPIPVLLISADDSLNRDAAREIGVNTFLAKPFANAVFREAVGASWRRERAVRMPCSASSPAVS